MTSRLPERIHLMVMGEGGAGKTCLTIQFVLERYVVEYDPTIEDVYRKHCIVDGQALEVDVLDTAQSEEFVYHRGTQIRQTDGVLLVYSMTDRQSFEQIVRYQRQFLREKDEEGWPMVLVATKLDMQADRQVSLDEGQELAKQFGCQHYETSAKENINIEDPFFDAIRLVRQRRQTILSEEIAAEEARQERVSKESKAGCLKCVAM